MRSQATSAALLAVLMVAVTAAARLPFSRDTEGRHSDDLITEIPGLRGELKSNHYGGYITVSEEHGRHLYYYFVESQRDPKNDPVVLWMNGGPGCSSFDGFVYEHGPFLYALKGAENDKYELTDNPYAWTTVANVLYLDSPAGVGMSYSDTPADYVTNDTRTAQDANAFLQGFFAKHPEFLDNEFYISGESYAGIYVPNLARSVMHGNDEGQKPTINLKGYLVGNGCTDPQFDGNAFPLFAMGKSLISTDLYRQIEEACEGQYWNVPADGGDCDALLGRMQQELSSLNIYDVLNDCFHGSEGGRYSERGTMIKMVRTIHRRWPAVGAVQPGKVQNWAYHLGSGAPPCTDTRVAELWLNDPDVRDAIHAASKKDIGRWQLCSGKIDYTHDIPTMIPIHKELIEKYGLRALVYSGDHDLCVPHTGSEAWTRSLEYKVTSPWQPWMVADEDDGQMDQVGGYVVEYGNLTYATIKGAGHMVPQTKPREGLTFFQRFIAGKQLTNNDGATSSRVQAS